MANVASRRFLFIFFLYTEDVNLWRTVKVSFCFAFKQHKRTLIFFFVGLSKSLPIVKNKDDYEDISWHPILQGDSTINERGNDSQTLSCHALNDCLTPAKSVLENCTGLREIFSEDRPLTLYIGQGRSVCVIYVRFYSLFFHPIATALCHLLQVQTNRMDKMWDHYYFIHFVCIHSCIHPLQSFFVQKKIICRYQLPARTLVLDKTNRLLKRLDCFRHSVKKLKLRINIITILRSTTYSKLNPVHPKIIPKQLTKFLPFFFNLEFWQKRISL